MGSVISDMRSESEQMIMQLAEIAYFMRGAVSYDELKFMSVYEKDNIISFITDRLANEMQKPNNDRPIY